jgi:hypothetical protein
MLDALIQRLDMIKASLQKRVIVGIAVGGHTFK